LIEEATKEGIAICILTEDQLKNELMERLGGILSKADAIMAFGDDTDPKVKAKKYALIRKMKK